MQESELQVSLLERQSASSPWTLHRVWSLGSEDFLNCLDFLFAWGGCGQSRTKSTLGLLTWTQQKPLWVLSDFMQKAGKFLKPFDATLNHRFNCTVEQSNPRVLSVTQVEFLVFRWELVCGAKPNYLQMNQCHTSSGVRL